MIEKQDTCLPTRMTAPSDGLSDIAKKVEAQVGNQYQGLAIYYTGTGAVGDAINTKIGDDLKKSETLAIPLTFILAPLCFRRSNRLCHCHLLSA